MNTKLLSFTSIPRGERASPYRMLYFSIDPFVGSRIAIGSLCTIDGIGVFVRCHLPDGVVLTGATAALVKRACERLEKNGCENQVASLGPCFSLGEMRWTPSVEDVRAWISLIGSSNEVIAKNREGSR